MLLFVLKNIMTKMRKFLFTDGDETKEVESISYKKAVKSYQGGSKSKMVTVEWEAKKGGTYTKEQVLPIGRKIRQAAESEKKRAALKAKIRR
jgi:hypothetical protein